MKRKKLITSSGIYQIQSKQNGNSYIGSAINIRQRLLCFHFKDLKKNNHYNPRMQNHVNKYGLDDLQFFILEFCPKNKLIEREQFWLDKLQPEFNICKIAGSRFGVKLSEEIKKKFQGINNPMYGIIGKDHHRYGTIHSDETRKRMRKNHANVKKENNPNYGKKTWLYGLTKETDERVQQISKRMKGNQINKGRKLSDEEKKKRSIAMKKWYETEAGKEWKKNNSGKNNQNYGKPRSEEVKRKISETKKKQNSIGFV